MDNNYDCGCGTLLKSATQTKTINLLRDGYCREMYETLGEVTKLEVKKDSLKELIAKKRCWFIWTERHYRTFRNLELSTGTRLLQTGDSVKDGIKKYVDVNKALAESLKKIAKTVKDVKDKANDLNEAACKLKYCLDDPCNCSQKIDLLGEPDPKYPGGHKPPGERPESCRDIDKNLEKLICMPKSLSLDFGSIFKSSGDVMGIQTFSNVTTLDPLQAVLGERIKKMEKGLTEVAKRMESEIKTVTDEINKSQKEFAKAAVELYGKRSDFEGIKDAVAYFCCPICSCVSMNVGDCEERLKDCAAQICKICKGEYDMPHDNCKDKQQDTAYQQTT